MNKDLVALAHRYFNISLPCTVADLKSAYRKESHKHHPDKTGGDDSYFKLLSEAYTILIATPEILQSEAAKEVPKTVDGILLSDLGTGISKDGVDCSTCDGKGYTTISDTTRYQHCKPCQGTGYCVTCPRCKGKGCPDCFEHGYLPLASGTLHALLARGLTLGYLTCKVCNGSGGMRINKTTYRHYKCGDCDGKGQKQLFNPVWAKMRMSK